MTESRIALRGAVHRIGAHTGDRDHQPLFGMFAISRSVALLAHRMEPPAEPQVIRPRGRYVGPVPQPGR